MPFRFLKEIKNYIIRFIPSLNTKMVLNTLGSYKTIPYIKAKSKIIFTKNTHLGKNCSFNGIIIQGSGKVVIGDNFHSGQDILVITSFHNYDKGKELPYDSSVINKEVIIEDNVWIGSRVIVNGGVLIGEGAVIQAGSVVSQNIPKFAIAGGHPAQAFKQRDIEHYEKLKSEKKFH